MYYPVLLGHALIVRRELKDAYGKILYKNVVCLQRRMAKRNAFGWLVV